MMLANARGEASNQRALQERDKLSQQHLITTSEELYEAVA